MQRRTHLLILALFASACGGSDAVRDGASETTQNHAERSLDALALDATSTSPEVAASAIAALRARGPEGHAALFVRYAPEIAALRAGDASDPQSERIRHAIDVVSGQRDGHASGLYWYTDLHEAERIASETHRPILSLRLLGRLDEEMSCANSRYFRTVLYANAELSAYLREHYVLHWSSERPVPRVTIDMGDGRQLTRTLTGNSIHYVIDAHGEVIDAMPGLNSPTEFLAFLLQAETAQSGDQPTRARLHEETFTRLSEVRAQALAASLIVPSPQDSNDSALNAMPLTWGKMVVETPILNALRAPAAPPVTLDPGDWRGAATTLFARHPEAVFDAQSRALLALKTGQSGATLDETMNALALGTVADGVKNDATLRWSIMQMLLNDEARDLESVNTRVYAEVFLTPASDPWLGLQHPDLWDAIERLH